MLKFECDLMPVDTPTPSGNVYSREVLERVRDQINERKCCHLIMNKPVDPTTPPSIIEAVGVLNGAEVTDAHLVVRGEITDPKLIEYMHASDVSFSAVGYGKVDTDPPHTSTRVVGDCYKFECATVLPADEEHEPNVRWEPCESD